jgi:Acyltransferase family
MSEVSTVSPDFVANVTNAQAKPAYNLSMGYLRAFLTILVLAHHSVLAYHPYAPPPPRLLTAPPLWWAAFPVVDTRRWSGFAVLVGFNDIFFMALMFFVSGLFVWQSLRRRGSADFLRHRLLRLGLPFVVGAGVIAPLAYYPAYLQTGARGGVSDFWHQWLALPSWPAGPVWFIWLLLAFDCLAAAMYLAAPGAGNALGKLLAKAGQRPWILFALLVLVSAIVYVPMAIAFTPMAWTSFGPFAFQTSRLLLYAVYFFVGLGIGAFGLGKGVLAEHGRLARHWHLWSLRALLCFGFAAVSAIAAVAAHGHAREWSWVGDFAFALSCAASGFAGLAIFVRFANKRNPVFDSLSDNAYGMYVIHYAFVSWLQYALLPAGLPAFVKGTIAFTGTLALSWTSVALLRRLPAVRRVI